MVCLGANHSLANSALIQRVNFPPCFAATFAWQRRVRPHLWTHARGELDIVRDGGEGGGGGELFSEELIGKVIN